MIRGITHTETGEPIQRLAVSTKVAIGLPPEPNKGRKAPMKLDFFVFLRKSPAAQNAWEIDPVLTKFYGNKCKEFEIVLLDDDMENVFPTKLAWFTASECKCFGDGETATRRTQEHPDGQPWTPCGKSCPDLERGDCKPSADLRFMLAAFPQLGSVARIHTSSYQSIRQISSSLQVLYNTFGRLAGLRCKLVVRPEKTSYMGNDSKRHTTTIYALNLEIQAADIKKLVEHTTDHARLFEHTRKMLGAGRVEVVEPENDRAGEISAEFYPPVSAVQFPKPEAEDNVSDSRDYPNMSVGCSACGEVDGHASDCSSLKPKSQKQPEPAMDAPAMCSECREIGKHKPDCKYFKADQDKLTAKLMKAAYVLKQVEEKTSKNKGKYLVLHVVTQDNQNGKLYVWHDHLKVILSAVDLSVPQGAILEVSEKEEKGQKFIAVEHVIEVAGTSYVEDKPAETTSPDLDMFDEPGVGE